MSKNRPILRTNCTENAAKGNTHKWCHAAGEGGYQIRDNSTDRLRDGDIDKGGKRSKNLEKLRDIIYGWSQRDRESKKLENLHTAYLMEAS